MRVAATVVALALGTVVGAAAATADPPPRCASGSLRAWAGHPGVGLGTIYREYGFLNVGRQTCMMRGFPAVTMFDNSGRRMPTIVRRTRPGATGYGTVTLVTLRKGERAWFVVFYADETGYGFDRCPTSARLRLTPRPAMATASSCAARAVASRHTAGRSITSIAASSTSGPCICSNQVPTSPDARVPPNRAHAIASSEAFRASMAAFLRQQA